MKQLTFSFFDQHKGLSMQKSDDDLATIVNKLIERNRKEPKVYVTVLLARGLKITLGTLDNGARTIRLSRTNTFPSMYEFAVVRKLLPFKVGEISRTKDIYNNQYVIAHEVKAEQCNQNQTQSRCFAH